MMLSPDEFSVGYIGGATNGLTLVLPRGRYERPMLITQASGSPYAVFLAGEHQFAGFECSKNETWQGVLIANVRVEIDEKSVFDAESVQSPLGSLVRGSTQLFVMTRDGDGFPRPIKTSLIVDLPTCSQNMAAGFKRWSIVLGKGTMKRELFNVACGDTAAS